jgi:UDP-galactopyranose mutase
VAEVVVVGAGLGGIAVAARLAKRRHTVTLVERSATVGGALRRIEQDGFAWDAGPASTVLPAVLRDLFRKSGRPLERYVELCHRPVARRHVFADGSTVDLPTGSRADQRDAVDAGLGPGTGAAWAAFVDAQAPVWDRLRREVLDRPDGGARLGDKGVVAALGLAEPLTRHLTRMLPDPRLRQMALHPHDLTATDPSRLPALLAVHPYVERTFGVWECVGGMAAVGDALATRLDERGVTVRTATSAERVVVDGGRARGVVLAGGEVVGADAVVAAVDPRQVLTTMLPRGAGRSSRRAFRGAEPAAPAAVTHLGLASLDADSVPARLPAEVVLHGAQDEATLVVTTTGSAPDGRRAWTVVGGQPSGQPDLLATLAGRGLDVRAEVVSRVDRSAADVLAEHGGVPWGLAWPGWRAYARRAAAAVPLPGLHLAGAGVHPGAGTAFVGWGAAHVAAAVDAALAGGPD